MIGASEAKAVGGITLRLNLLRLLTSNSEA